MDVRERIDSLVKENPVVLFMKGSRHAPQCGFSARVVAVLDDYLPEYTTVNVLEDPEVRQGIKEFSSWPTIPQLYVKGEFVGGCDIVSEMSQSGELDDVLGASRPELRPPEITVTDEALAALASFQEGEDAPTVRLEITSSWQYAMDFDAARPSDVVVDGKKWRLVMNRATARKADGMTIGYVEGSDGAGFKIDNPNEPPKVRQLPPEELSEWMKEGKPLELIDVRTQEERSVASIEGARHLDDALRTQLESMDRAKTLVFHCHHGMRSQRAAEHALAMGFRDVYNLAGGIDAWSQKVNESVPRY